MLSTRCCAITLLLSSVILILLLTHAYKRFRYKPLDEEKHGQEEVQKYDRFLVDRPLEFVRPVETRHLDCARMFTDQNAALEYARERLVYQDPPWPDDLPSDCRSILRRNFFQLERIYADEERFPLAFVRVVYKDYRQVEMELASTYAPQNTYCYALDAKASKTFHLRMNALAACLPNVYVTRVAYRMNSSGHNMNRSFLECLRILQNMEWKYAILLQNHDVALKTNQELIRILSLYNGTNDVGAREAPLKRIRPGVNWSFKWLNVFRNKTRNTRPHNHQPPVFQLIKSLAQVALTREAVDFMLEELNLDRLIDALEWDSYGVDELLMGTLNANDAVDLPGGFTLQCLRRGVEIGSLTRLSLWHNNTACRSGIKRHRICIFGMEDLQPNLSSSPHLFANKFMMEKDFGALVCWHELIFNRTHHERGTYRLDRTIYEKLPQVRFNRERRLQGADFQASQFRC